MTEFHVAAGPHGIECVHEVAAGVEAAGVAWAAGADGGSGDRTRAGPGRRGALPAGNPARAAARPSGRTAACCRFGRTAACSACRRRTCFRRSFPLTALKLSRTRDTPAARPNPAARPSPAAGGRSPAAAPAASAARATPPADAARMFRAVPQTRAHAHGGEYRSGRQVSRRSWDPAPGPGATARRSWPGQAGRSRAARHPPPAPARGRVPGLPRETAGVTAWISRPGSAPPLPRWPGPPGWLSRPGQCPARSYDRTGARWSGA